MADFPNVADWNGGVKNSYSTGDATSGVGATRHCDLSPTGTLEETIREWTPGEKFVVSIDSSTKLPIKQGLVTFDLSDGADAASSNVDVTYDYETKWGIVGKALGGLLDRQLTKGFSGFLSDLETAASQST